MADPSTQRKTNNKLASVVIPLFFADRPPQQPGRYCLYTIGEVFALLGLLGCVVSEVLLAGRAFSLTYPSIGTIGLLFAWAILNLLAFFGLLRLMRFLLERRARTEAGTTDTTV